MPRLGLINALRGPVPPDGYRWKCPECGWENQSFDYPDWIQKAAKHIASKGKEVPSDLELAMQEQLCMTLPPGWCNYDDPNRNRVVVSTLGWEDVLRGTETLSRWAIQGAHPVSAQEADRRARICANCYLNVGLTGCSACQSALQLMAKGYSTKHDQFLRSCGACKCYLKLKVHIPLEILDKENSGVQELYPSHCWLKRGGTNHGSPTDVSN